MHIFDLYSTKQEALGFLDRMSDYSDALFRVKDKAKAFDKYFTKEEQEALVKEKWEVGSGKWELDMRGETVKKLLIKLQEVVQNIPKVYLTLALNPTVLIMNQISQKLSQHIAKPFFLEISLDKNIIAGAILSYQGVQKDYSIKSKLS